jgi:hypothetical protein
VPRLSLESARTSGRLEVFDPAPAYRAQLERLVDVEPLRRAGLTVVVDSMWGNGAGWLAQLVGGGPTNVFEVRRPSLPGDGPAEPSANVDAGLQSGPGPVGRCRPDHR